MLHVCNRRFRWATGLTVLCSTCAGAGAAESFQKAGEAVNKVVQKGVANVKEAFDIIDDNVLDYCNLDPAVSARNWGTGALHLAETQHLPHPLAASVRKPLQHLSCWWPCDVMQLLPHIYVEGAAADAVLAGKAPKRPDELGREGGTVHGCLAGKSPAVCNPCLLASRMTSSNCIAQQSALASTASIHPRATSLLWHWPVAACALILL